MKHDLFSEILNGLIFMLGLYAVGVFVSYTWRNRHEDYKDLRPALALLTVFAGDTLVRFSYWYARHAINLGHIPQETLFYCGATAGGIITAWGILCVMRVFATSESAPRVWKVALLSAVMWTILWSAPHFTSFMRGLR